MSYALESKKRKFHRVLDSISNSKSQEFSSSPEISGTPVKVNPRAPSSPSVTAATPEPVPVSPTIKRVRITPRSERDDTAVRPSPGLSRRPSESGSVPRPNFVPWDRNRFLERLKTFRRVDRWSPKPAPINEVQWAKRGWSCTDAMRVECVGGCGQSMVVKLPDEIDELEEYDSDKIEERREIRARLVEEYSKLITEGHGEKCPWRKSGCDDTIHRLPLSKPETALQCLRTRYMDLLSLGDKLPLMETLEIPGNLSLPELFNIMPPGVLSDINSNNAEKKSREKVENREKEMSATHVNTVAFALALFGWDVCGDAAAGLASCKACFRRLGLWMYKPKDDGRSSIYAHLNVADEHLEYCPWINAKTQTGRERKGVTSYSGWQLLEQAIHTAHQRKIWLGNVTSRPGSSTSAAPEEDIDNEVKKAKDKEWWARVRRLQQALHIGGSKKAKSAPVTK